MDGIYNWPLNWVVVEAYVEDHNWDGGQIERVNLRLGLNSCARCIRLWISPLLFFFQNDWTLLDIEFPSRLKDFYPYGRQMRWSLEGSKWWWPNIKIDRIYYSVPTSWCRKISCLSHWFGPSYDSAFKRIEGCPSNCIAKNVHVVSDTWTKTKKQVYLFIVHLFVCKLPSWYSLGSSHLGI